MLSRLIFGARVSMVVGFTAVIFAGVVGTALGIISGYLGGWVDQVIMRLTDTWLALPALTFAIFLAAIVGPSMWNIVIILGLTYWTRYARVIRGEVLSLKEREFVRLAIVAGCSKWTIMRRHILPNVINSAIVLGTLMLGVVIITEATLSFLGVGVPPPQPAWGLMLSDGKQGLMVGYWWLTVFPGLLHHADGAVGQPSRRLAARQARPAAAAALMPLGMTGDDGRPLLELRQPLDPLRLGAGHPRRARGRRRVAAHQCRRDARHRRRKSGSGKSTLALTHPARAAAGGAHRQRPDAVRGRGPRRKIRRRDAPGPRQADRDDPAGPDGVAEPAVHDRRPGRRADPGA